MNSVSIELVREFFETGGFAVLINRKHQLGKGHIAGRDLIDLLVTNLDFSPPKKELPLILRRSSEVSCIARATVGVKGWHSQTFSASRLAKMPSMLEFVAPEAMEYAQSRFGEKEFATILIVPRLTDREDGNPQTRAALKKAGVDHLLEFTTVVNALISRVKVNNNYAESHILQLIRIMKCYGYLKGSQLELPLPG